MFKCNNIYQSAALAAPVSYWPAPLLGDVCTVAVVILAAARGRRRGRGGGGGGLGGAGGAACLAAPVDSVDMVRYSVDVRRYV